MKIYQAAKKIKTGKIAVPRHLALSDLRTVPYFGVNKAVEVDKELLLADWVVLPEYLLSVGSVFIKSYRKKHPLLKLPAVDYAGSAVRKFIEDTGIINADKVLVAYRGGNVVGFSRFFTWKKRNYDGGTWVREDHRRLGLASLLLEKAIAKYGKLILTATTKNGVKLGKAIKEKNNKDVVLHIKV